MVRDHVPGGRRTFPDSDGPEPQEHRGRGRGNPSCHPGRRENWNWRRERYRPTDDLDLIEFIVAEANTLAVRVYDIHPFLDGNTRATWHLLTMNLSRVF
jgi:hypothetical protein